MRRLRLNRHLPEVDLLAEHNHPFAQILCYLHGGGLMTAEGRDYEIGPNALVMLPRAACIPSVKLPDDGLSVSCSISTGVAHSSAASP